MITDKPDEVWPILEVKNSLSVSVINKGEAIPETPSGVFQIKEYFSPSSSFGDAGGGLEAHIDDSVYMHTSAVGHGETIHVQLQGWNSNTLLS